MKPVAETTERPRHETRQDHERHGGGHDSPMRMRNDSVQPGGAVTLIPDHWPTRRGIVRYRKMKG